MPIAAADRAPAHAAGVRGDGLEPAGWIELEGPEAITL